MIKKLKWSLVVVLCIAMVFTIGLMGCKTTESAETTAAKALKIAYFVSDLSNVFHQAQFAEGKKYAMEKYGAEVFAFDGKSDGNVMTQNIDQIVAQGMTMATLHIWDAEAAKPGVMEAISKGVIINSFFSPLGDTGIPVVRSDEAGISFEMGKQMAEQWKKAFPDKPIVMVQLGWPNHTDLPPDDLQGSGYIKSFGGERLPGIYGKTHMGRFCIDRHSRKVNIAFADAHVERVKLEKLWQLKWHKKFRSKRNIKLPYR